MDGHCPKCRADAVPVNPYEWEDEFEEREVDEAFKHIHLNGMEVWACLHPDCETLFIMHPKDT